MTDNQTPPPASYPPIEYVFRERKRNPIRRAGCTVLLIFWFLFLLTPLCLFVLAVQGEITIAHFGDVPESYQHPLFQVQLVMEEDYRGLRIVNATLHNQTDEAICVQTNVRYLLWEGEGDPATFCRCYEREITESVWNLSEEILEACK
ncbi:MAG: hypothetical protein MUE54_06185 [Anaerolineae bacterium]|jgi:hypothetical protein|nr:hypothetical protein [Anaerolineae bacterium]